MFCVTGKTRQPPAGFCTNKVVTTSRRIRSVGAAPDGLDPRIEPLRASDLPSSRGYWRFSRSRTSRLVALVVGTPEAKISATDHFPFVRQIVFFEGGGYRNARVGHKQIGELSRPTGDVTLRECRAPS